MANTVRSAISVYNTNGQFTLTLRDCFKMRMYWLSALPAGGAQAVISGPFITGTVNALFFPSNIQQPSGDWFFQNQVLVFDTPDPSLFLNDEFSIVLKNFNDADQFVVQQQLIVKE